MGLGYAVLVIIILKPFLHMKMKLYLSFVFVICIFHLSVITSVHLARVVCVAIVHIMGYQIVATEMQKRKKIARMNISAPKISTKNAYFATFGNLRQNSVNSLELNQVALMFA